MANKKKTRKKIVIDGGAFDDMRGFYDHVIPMLTDGNFEAGRNLDAFNDLLRGGFGAHGYGQPVEIVWKEFARSRELLGDSKLLTIVQIILDADGGHDCTLKIEE